MNTDVEGAYEALTCVGGAFKPRRMENKQHGAHTRESVPQQHGEEGGEQVEEGDVGSRKEGSDTWLLDLGITH